MFARVLRSSRCVLAMDAFLEQKTIRVLQEILNAPGATEFDEQWTDGGRATPKNTVFYVNKHTAHMARDVFIHRSSKSINLTLELAVCRGQGVAIAHGTKRQARLLKQKLEKKFLGVADYLAACRR
eukprot:g30859.t1